MTNWESLIAQRMRPAETVIAVTYKQAIRKAKDRKLLRALLDKLCPGIAKDNTNKAEAPARPEPDLSAWTSEGKTHEQMLKEKMAMHNGFPMPDAQPKRRGRKPKVKEEA